MKYAITAATGHFGQYAVAALNHAVGADNVIVIARNQEKATKLFPNNEVRIGDYDSAPSMTEALHSVDRVLFISSQPGGPVARLDQHQNVIAALQANHVALTVYTSFPHADQAQSALASDHRATEVAIQAAGLKHSFVRNNWYLENEAGFIQALAHQQPSAYWTDQAMGWAAEQDYARAAVKVLTMDDPQPSYELAGPIRTYAQLGQDLASTLNITNTATLVTREAYIAGLEQAGLDHDTASLFASFQEPAAVGDLRHASADLINLMDGDLTPLTTVVTRLVEQK